MNRLRLCAVMGLILICAVSAARTAVAQSVTPDDLAGVVLGDGELAGFHVVGDSGAAGPLRDQLTRTFSANPGVSHDITVFTIILTTPRDNNPCLPLVPASIASGLVFSVLNGFKQNFALFGSVGAGDVDMTATWADPDPGRNDWSSVYAAAFMRGRLTIYMYYRSYDVLPNFDRFAAIVMAQDAKLQAAAAAAPDSPVGRLLTTAVPPADTAPRDCYDVPGG